MQQPLDQNETHRPSPDRACCQLLRAIVQPFTTDAQLCQIAQNIRDWDELLRVSSGHRVLPLLFARLAQAGASLPPAARQRFASEYRRNVFHCMANAAELIAILASFSQHAIPAMPFKGVVLAASVYGDANARAAGDLDLLIHAHDLRQATELLLNRGYELHTPARADLSPAHPECHEYHFERPRDGMVAELRWKLELVTPRYRRSLGMDWAWSHRRSTILADAEVPDLDRETTLLMLCMHGSKHSWTRLAWLVDVAQLLNSGPNLDWNAIDREAKRTGLWRTLALGVLLAHSVAGASVPQAMLRRFQSPRAVRRIAQSLGEHIIDAPGTVPRSVIPYSIRLLGFRDRLRLVLSLALIQPNPRDHAFVDLPRPFHALYYLVRPLRLLLNRTPR